MYLQYSIQFFRPRAGRPMRRPGLMIVAGALLVALTVACGEQSRNLPSHLAQKSAVELNAAGLQLHSQDSFKHSAMYFEFATMQNPAYFEGHYNRARALARIGETGEALRALKTAYNLNAEWVVERLADPDLDSLRSESDFSQSFAEDIAVR
ncbi:MAG: hypothetical protein RIF32_14685 [Leptospirales bacterium]